MKKYNRNEKCKIESPSGQVACKCVDFEYQPKGRTCSRDFLHDNYTECVILKGLDCPYYSKGFTNE